MLNNDGARDLRRLFGSRAVVVAIAVCVAVSIAGPASADTPSTVWGAGITVTPPANAATGAGPSRLASVSCPSAGNCGAIGFYADSERKGQAFLLNETAGVWASAVEATPPGDAGENPAVFLTSLSCASAGNCTAVGTYNDSSKNQQGLLLTQTAGVWATGIKAPLPSGAAPQTGSGFLTSVSCASAGNCAAIGRYT